MTDQILCPKCQGIRSMRYGKTEIGRHIDEVVKKIVLRLLCEKVSPAKIARAVPEISRRWIFTRKKVMNLSVIEAFEKSWHDEALFADFISECCFQKPKVKTKSSKLYSRFVEWYHANVGKKEPSDTWFGKQLTQRFNKHKSHGLIVYHGIGLINEQGELEGY